MSRGLGAIESKILEDLRRVTNSRDLSLNSVEIWDSSWSLGWESPNRKMTVAESSSLRRAAWTLHGKGLIDVKSPNEDEERWVGSESASMPDGRRRLVMRLHLTEDMLRAVVEKHRRAVRIKRARLTVQGERMRLRLPPGPHSATYRSHVDPDQQFLDWYQRTYEPVAEGRWYDEREVRRAAIPPPASGVQATSDALAGHTLFLG